MRSLSGFAIATCLAMPYATSAAPATAWIVDKATSAVRFASSLNGEAFSGSLRRWDADIRFDPANLAGSAVTASFDATSAATGDRDRDQALPTADFLETAHFPRAKFEAHTFKALGGGRYLASGTLTLRGVSKPLTLPFTLSITGPQARMTGSVAINRLAFGVGQNEWKSTQALPATVTVTVSLNARKAG
jgi:polyisoprenoid-binding protein YceI